MGEQGAHLVAAEHPPPVRGGHGRSATVGVRVVGDHEVRAVLRRQRHREVHRARLLRVGEGHRREVRVGMLLLAHDAGRVEARGLEDLDDRGAADPVEGCVDDRQVAGAVLGAAPPTSSR